MFSTLTFVFRDENWPRKLAISSLCLLVSLIPVLGLIGSVFHFGYLKKLFRNVLEGQEHPLPDWDDLGSYLSDGFKGLLIVLVYLVPIGLICLLVFLTSIVAPGLTLLFTAVLPESYEQVGFGVGAFAMATAGLFMAFINVLLLLAASYSVLGILRCFATDSLASGFAIAANTRLMLRNKWAWTKTFVVSLAIFCFGTILGLLLCAVGSVVTLPWSMLTIYKIFGDFWSTADHS